MLKTNITYHRVKTEKELNAILTLQQENLPESLTDGDKVKEGFVSIKHDLDILKRMNTACAHCIAKQDDKVVGYTLSMLQSFKTEIPLLIPMFNEIDKELLKQNKTLSYVVMGQICIDKSMRGQGVFRGLYNYMAQELKSNFNAIITEVDAKNIRSSNAHKAVGFEILKEYESNNRVWELIILNIK
ncbi:N-acetyltransferase family protein [Pontimicrobium sp. MEBiC01747]